LAAAGDPVGNGLVASLARTGGNVTGSSLELNDTASNISGSNLWHEMPQELATRLIRCEGE